MSWADESMPYGGKVRQTFLLTPTIQAAAYSTGNLLGTLLTLAKFGRSKTLLSGRIMTVSLIDKAKQNSAIDVCFFSTALPGSVLTDKAAFAPAAADLLTFVGSVSIAGADWLSFSANSAATKGNLGLNVLAGSDQNLYAVLVCRGTPTYASVADLQLLVGADQD